MAKRRGKTIEWYEEYLKRYVLMRTKSDHLDEWLEPQLHDAAMCQQMLERMHEEIMNGKLAKDRQGVKENVYLDAHPLLPSYNNLHRTITKHLEALGLNKISRTMKDDGDEDAVSTGIAEYYKNRKR